MRENVPTPGAEPREPATRERLDSWKEIASYLNRSVRTVARWESEEGLPVHRHVHSKTGTVYAYRLEIDAWWANRGKQIENEPPRAQASSKPWFRQPWMMATATGALSLLVAVGWLSFRSVPRLVPPR